MPNIHRIFLVRHGQSEGNVDKSVHRTTADHAIPLSEEGIRQAHRAGVFLRKLFKREQEAFPQSQGRDILFPARLWTSPYRRARQTAEAIALACGKVGFPHYGFLDAHEARENFLLAEQQFGLFDGIPDEELATLYPAEHAYYEKCKAFGGRFWSKMPLGESRFDVTVRVAQTFGTFHRDAQNDVKNLIVVSHGTTIRAFLMAWLHRSPEWFEAEPNPKNCSVRLIEDNKDCGYIYQE